MDEETRAAFHYNRENEPSFIPPCDETEDFRSIPNNSLINHPLESVEYSRIQHPQFQSYMSDKNKATVPLLHREDSCSPNIGPSRNPFQFYPLVDHSSSIDSLDSEPLLPSNNQRQQQQISPETLELLQSQISRFRHGVPDDDESVRVLPDTSDLTEPKRYLRSPMGHSYVPSHSVHPTNPPRSAASPYLESPRSFISPPDMDSDEDFPSRMIPPPSETDADSSLNSSQQQLELERINVDGEWSS